MFRKYILCIALAAASFNANAACEITYVSSSGSVKEQFHGTFGLANYDEICEKLNKAHAAISIEGASNVWPNQSVSWAAASVKDARLPIFTSDFGGNSTWVSTIASTDKAEEILRTAIKEAIEEVDIEKALESLEIARKKVRASYKK